MRKAYETGQLRKENRQLNAALRYYHTPPQIIGQSVPMQEMCRLIARVAPTKAGLPASYTFAAADAGVHSFAATLRTAGTQSISVRDATGALTGAQMGISVSPAAFTDYKLSVPLATDSKGHMLVTAGDAIPLTVRAQDEFGNLVAGYNDTVTFSSTDTRAGLPAAYGFTAADAGAHTFSVDLRTTTPNGVAWSFSVVGASNAATLATITNFEVVNAAAASFVMSVPSNITAGTPFSLKVSVLDAFGNRVKNYFGTVHFTNTAGTIGLPADYSFNSIDAGDHTVTLMLSTVGSQTLSVIDTVNIDLGTTVTVDVATAPTNGGGGNGGGGGGKNAG